MHTYVHALPLFLPFSLSFSRSFSLVLTPSLSLSHKKHSLSHSHALDGAKKFKHSDISLAPFFFSLPLSLTHARSLSLTVDEAKKFKYSDISAADAKAAREVVGV